MTARVPRWVLGAIYLPPAFALLASGIRLVIEAANPKVSVATFAFMEQGLPMSALVLHVVGLGTLIWHSVARARARVAPAWSMVPAFIYYALVLAVLLALAVLGSDDPAPIWAI